MKYDDVCHIGLVVSYPVRRTEAFRGVIGSEGSDDDTLCIKASFDKTLVFKGYNGFGIKDSGDDEQNLITELLDVSSDDEIISFINKWGFFILLPDEDFVSFRFEQIRSIVVSIKDLVLFHAALEIDPNDAIVVELYKKLDGKVIHFTGYRIDTKIVDFSLKAKEILTPVSVSRENFPQLALTCRECWLVALLKAFPVRPAYNLKTGRVSYVCPDFMRALLVTLAATDFTNYVLEKGEGDVISLRRI